jgi:hypothetical protein
MQTQSTEVSISTAPLTEIEREEVGLRETKRELIREIVRVSRYGPARVMYFIDVTSGLTDEPRRRRAFVRFFPSTSSTAEVIPASVLKLEAWSNEPISRKRAIFPGPQPEKSMPPMPLHGFGKDQVEISVLYEMFLEYLWQRARFDRMRAQEQARLDRARSVLGSAV